MSCAVGIRGQYPTLPHLDQCLMCDQDDENIQHLLVGCVFARQFWFCILSSVGLTLTAPKTTDLSFEAWWDRAESAVSVEARKGLNSLITLGAWIYLEAQE